MSCGIELNIILSDLNLEHSAKANEIKVRCVNYVTELFKQMQQQFPENIQLLESLIN